MPLILLGVTSMWSCMKEEATGCPEFEGDPYLTLSLQLPKTTPSTYALSAMEENAISALDVLVFKVDPEDVTKEYFLYRVATADITDITNTTVTGNRKSYRVKLRMSEADARHRLVLVANQRSAIDANVATADVGVTLKETMLQRLTFATSAVWVADSGDAGYKSIPMWGEARNTHVVTKTTTTESIGTIGMVRALARFDVGVKYNATYVAQGLDNFLLTDIYVYNSTNMASGVPAAANYSKDSQGFATVSTVTIPAGANIISNFKPLHYALATGRKSLESTIYIPETKALNYGATPTVAQMQGQFCLVVGGYYSTAAQVADATPNTTTKSYYRIDIYDRLQTAPQGNLLDILRNRLYKVSITNVPGPGTKTPFEALTQTPLGFTSTVLQWDAGGTDGNVSTDNDNYDGDETIVDPWDDGGKNEDINVNK